MNRKIKVIWDFYGDKSQKTAERHAEHVAEFMEKHKLPFFETGTASAADFHTMSFLTVSEEHVYTVRDALKPQRAFIVE
ncbi:MAG: hypothetical protein IPM74_09470 [Crocinitomicaceae bacterium]|nr:hypothetical protein [Crocinitomicaceae bacterium]MBK8926122.1 hypothetical protein [Crocinitomicaceae bacterium]